MSSIHSMLALVCIATAGCATQSPPVPSRESVASASEQRVAQSTATRSVGQPTLKRKLALGRLTNETQYGRSLLRDSSGDPLGKQVTDLFSKGLVESGAYIVLERPDVSRLQAESVLTGSKLDLVGVDALIVGSLTEFGRKTVGQSGFASNTKKQVAFAKLDIRLVDATTGVAFFSASGAGEASTESGSTFGFGSQAAYDGTLNDAAIRQAVSEAISKLTVELSSRPWTTSFLSTEQGRLFIAGGKSQGIRPGMLFAVTTVGEKVRSPQTGFVVTLPGTEIAILRVDSTFGDTEWTEGSAVTLVSGSLQHHPASQLVIRMRANS